jgi:hypothetical protein
MTPALALFKGKRKYQVRPRTLAGEPRRPDEAGRPQDAIATASPETMAILTEA